MLFGPTAHHLFPPSRHGIRGHGGGGYIYDLVKRINKQKKTYLRWPKRHLRVVWAHCPSSSIATRHCLLFVVVVNIYIYELVKSINKRKKTYLSPKFRHVRVVWAHCPSVILQVPLCRDVMVVVNLKK